MTPSDRHCYKTYLLLLLVLVLSSCTSTLTTALVGPALENMQQQSDVELVCEGTPPYLLMIDSIIASDPQDPDLLILGAKAYSGYIGAMQECGLSKDRIAAMADKAHLYGIELLSPIVPISPTNTLDELDEKLQHISKGYTARLFWGAFAWISWIERQAGAPAAMADIGKIEKILIKIIELDETFLSGAAHFLLGAYYGSKPKMFGGKPELSKFHFDKSLKISGRKMLIFQTTYAQTLARLTMDKELHDSLLLEVINFVPESSPENMLANQIAIKRAKRLIQENYFAD
jgi:hypothetical protein